MALNIFNETTSAAISSYFPNEATDAAAAAFLKVINIWWIMSNTKSKYNTHNRFGNAATLNDKKPQLFRVLDAWLEEWQQLQICACSKFSLSAQTFDAFITTLRGTAAFLEDLFLKGYDYVLIARLKSDPLEKHFGKYRQMSGGRFRVSLHEVQNCENILFIKSLIKADVDSWDERVKCDIIDNRCDELLQKLKLLSNEIQENDLCDDGWVY